MPTVRSRGSVSLTMGVIRNGTPVEPDPEITHAPQRLAIELHSPVQDKLLDYVETNAQRSGIAIAEMHKFLGQSVALCGAGPSLRDETIRGVDQIWACNSALPYLVAADVPVTAAVGIDQTPGLLREWADPPNVLYYLASSCDPALVDHLLNHGRQVVFFHSFVSIAPSPDEELAIYRERFPGPTVVVGEGMTVSTRSIGLAQWMGFERVDLYGVDCCFSGDVAHANGDSPQDAYGKPQIMRAVLGGREWLSRPDMLLDAVQLVRRVRASQGRIRIVGDTFPAFLLGKSDEFLDAVCYKGSPEQLTEKIPALDAFANTVLHPDAETPPSLHGDGIGDDSEAVRWYFRHGRDLPESGVYRVVPFTQSDSDSVPAA